MNLTHSSTLPGIKTNDLLHGIGSKALIAALLLAVCLPTLGQTQPHLPANDTKGATVRIITTGLTQPAPAPNRAMTPLNFATLQAPISNQLIAHRFIQMGVPLSTF